jgi:hypothetical protein
MSKKIPPILLRRYDGHKIEKTMKNIATQVYFGTENKQEFKEELSLKTVANYLWTKYDIDVNEIKYDDLSSMADYIKELFDPLMDVYYRSARKHYPRR